eukprot:7039376-Pyramimonas_sp.AAC.1
MASKIMIAAGSVDDADDDDDRRSGREEERTWDDCARCLEKTRIPIRTRGETNLTRRSRRPRCARGKAGRRARERRMESRSHGGQEHLRSQSITHIQWATREMARKKGKGNLIAATRCLGAKLVWGRALLRKGGGPAFDQCSSGHDFLATRESSSKRW